MTAIDTLGAPLYVTDPAAVIRKDGGRIVVTVDGQLRASAPLRLLTEVVLLGPANVSTQALVALLRAEVPVAMLTVDGRAIGRLEPPGSPNVAARRAQLRRADDDELRRQLAAEFLGAKLINQRVALLRLGRRDGLSEQSRTALAQLAARIDSYRERLSPDLPVAAQFGIEGAAAAAYFGGLRAGAAVDGFERRDRTSSDLLNLAINYCSGLVRESVVGAICAAGLDPYVSFLHEPMRGRPTLAFDLMEEWRPLLVEGTALATINLGRLTPADVVVEGPRPHLSPEARRRLVERHAMRLRSPASERTVDERLFGRTEVTYRDLLFRQALSLRRHLQGGEPYRGFRWK